MRGVVSPLPDQYEQFGGAGKDINSPTHLVSRGQRSKLASTATLHPCQRSSYTELRRLYGGVTYHRRVPGGNYVTGHSHSQQLHYGAGTSKVAPRKREQHLSATTSSTGPPRLLSFALPFHTLRRQFIKAVCIFLGKAATFHGILHVFSHLA